MPALPTAPVIRIADTRLALWLTSNPDKPVLSNEPIVSVATRCAQVRVPNCLLPIFWPLIPGCYVR
jgi:hypothetical protein